MQYAVVVEPSENGYGAYVPDLPGCVALGDTVDETLRLVQEAIETHLDGMREDGDRIPESKAVCEYVVVG